MKTFKDIPYGTVEKAIPFFYDEPIGRLSKRDSHRLVFMLSDTVKRLADDVKIAKAELEEKNKNG